MSNDIKVTLLLDKYEKRKESIMKEYNKEYAAIDVTPESTIALNMWLVEEEGKAEKWFIEELKKIFEGV